MVDVMVLGNSLQEHGVKAQKLLCINEDTLENNIANLMRAFWQFVRQWKITCENMLGT